MQDSKYQLHVSGLNMLAKCPEQFRRRYVEGERIPPGIAAIVGTAVDRSVTANLGHKIEAGSLLPPDAVQDIARDAINAEWERGVLITDEDREEGTDSKGEAVDKSVSLAALHHAEVAPVIEPTHVQRAWVLDIHGLPVQLAGTIDVQEGLRAIRDTKTSGKTPKADAADKSLQLTTYALAVRQIDGRIPDKVVLDFCVRTPKTHKTSYKAVESTRTEAQLKPLFARIVQACEAMEKGVFTPAQPDSWQCSPRWCGYWQTCPYALHPVSVAIDGQKGK